MSLPPTITQTTIWQRTLADTGDDHERAAKAQLWVAFEEAREKARKLAEEIPRYLPEFTDHSIDHMDSLWRIADHILPEDYLLNPAEAFVFGCADLVHDCAMSVAAYPGGMDEIRRHPMWRDLLAQTHREMRGRRAKPEELDAPERDVEDCTLGMFLRHNHAAQAEMLPRQAWFKSEMIQRLMSGI